MTVNTQKIVNILGGFTGPTGTFEQMNVLSTFTGPTGTFPVWQQATGATGPNGTFKSIIALGPTGSVNPKGTIKTVIIPNYSILPAAMRSNPPDVFFNFATNQAQKPSSAWTSATSLLTISRASTGWASDASGNWTSFAANTARITNQGLLVEESRTNSIRNSSMAGAVVMADNVELTTNGNFASAGAGWTQNVGSGAITFSTGSVQFTGDGSTYNTWISQQVTGLVPGRNYVVSITQPAAGTVYMTAGNSPGDETTQGKVGVVGNGNASSTLDRASFTATATSHWVSLKRQGNTTVTVTSISIKDGERCENGGFTSSPVNASQSTVQNGWQWTNSTGTGTVVYNGSGAGVTLTGDGTHQAAVSAAIPTVSGFTYTLTVDLITNAATVQAGTSAFNASLLNVTTASVGTGQKFQFTATGTTTYITFGKVGAVACTVNNVSVQSAGALPTNWRQTNLFNNGPVASVVNVGTESGINFIDVQVVGTTTGAVTAQIGFESVSQIAASYGQTWTSSLFAYLSAGSGTNILNFKQAFDENTSGGTFIASHTTTFTPSTTGPLGSNRQSQSATVNGSTAGAVYPYVNFNWNNAVAINFTLRLGGPQLENNSLINSTVASAALSGTNGSGGTNGTAVYSVGGGTGSTTATLNITIAGGVLSAVNSVANAGSYTTFPPSPATLTYVSGTGTGLTGATVNLTPTNNAALAFATSPIPTSGSAATRNSDVVTMTSPPAFGAAYSLFASGTPQSPASTAISQNALEISTGSTSQRTLIRRSNTGTMLVGSVGGSNTQVNPTGTWTTGALFKLAGAFAASDQAGVANGGTLVTASGASLPTTPTQVSIGVNASTTEQFNGYLSQAAIWASSRVSNANLQSITT